MNRALFDRVRGLIWGQFLGDAASLGAHWIYNLEDLRRTYPEGIRGFEEPGRGHYHAGKTSGMTTHYGDAAWLLLESLVANGGLDICAFGSAFVHKMDPGKGYRGYFDSATRGTLENYKNAQMRPVEGDFAFQSGADDDQLATISSLGPLVALWAWRNGTDDEFPAGLLADVAALTRVRQNHDRAVAYCQAHALILLQLLAGRDIHTAFHRVEALIPGLGQYASELLRKIKEAFDLKHKSVIEATGILGQSCPLICSFPSAVQAVAKHNEDFEVGILAVISAGGDNAGRAAVAGSWMGARIGHAGLPEAWTGRLVLGPRIDEALARLFV